ncbi:MAG TPA: CDP-diacylglycerol--glycerol-3-phosphate 3-phosphatidyltransferase [Rhizomicrobium sp.]|jgi:cardiolipin synthase|nr:CDP-diacylglycerol--glycerol-3-phosphate 3-phosphatidyltransferase [Rhizomicrobium sp.]
MTGPLRQLPNFLTAIRIVLAPLTAWLIFHGQDLAALFVFAFAGASDWVDGFLARRYGLVSRFGEYLDPAADKLLMLACFVTLAVIGQAPLWLTAIVIGRDVAIVLGVLIAQVFSLPVKMEPLAVGKASTVVQIGYIGLVLLLLTVGVVMPVLVEAAALIAAGFTLMSWFSYGQLLLKAFATGRRPA